jgi:hypothetical protein
MRAQEFIRENKQATAQQVLAYINQTHHEPMTEKLTAAVQAHPQWELRPMPLRNLNIPDQDYQDPEQEPESDPYNRVMAVDPDYANEYSTQVVDRLPIVVDDRGYIIDGNHRAWAAAELLNRDRIQAWVPVKQGLVEYSLFDLHHEFFEEINQLDIALFENKEDYLRLKKTLDNFSTSVPTTGKNYVYASVAATPAGKIMNIAHFTQVHQLIDIKDGRYYFNINGTVRVFPEQGRFDKQDSYQHIFMFDTVQQFEKMSGWINLTYSNDNQWKVGSKKLDENFADGKVKGRSRPGRVKRSGASCNGSVTDLRARAKRASGEKAKMYHWCANMKSGRKK